MGSRSVTKPTNPKDSISSSRIPLELVPDVVKTEAAFAFLEGALKYGRFNWRVAGVRASVYKAAVERHLAKWWNGEDCDRKTRVKHLASIIASVGILLDAELCAMLTDDRPPAADISSRIDSGAELVKHLQELFKDHHPHQYTIKDKPWPTHQKAASKKKSRSA